jgi:hypothetical protein
MNAQHKTRNGKEQQEQKNEKKKTNIVACEPRKLGYAMLR